MASMASIALVLHMLWHLIATIGVLYTFEHSNAHHGNKWWKQAASLLWLALSVALAIDVFFHGTC